MKLSDFLICCAVLLIWSSSSTLVSVFAPETNPFIVAGIVVLVAFILLSFGMLNKNNRSVIRSFSLKEYAKLIAPGLLGLFLYPIFYFGGISGTSPIKANILNYLWPLFAVLWEWIIHKIRINRIEKTAFALAVVGAYVVMFFGNNELISSFEISEIKYEVVAFLGAVTYGAYTAIIKINIPKIKTTSRQYDRVFEEKNNMPDFIRMYFMVVISLIAHMLIFLYFFLFDKAQIQSTIKYVIYSDKNRISLLFYSGVNFTLAHFLWNKINTRNNASLTSSMAFLIPAASTIVLSKVSGTPISIAAAVGLILILVSILINNRSNINSINVTIFSFAVFFILEGIFPINDNDGVKETARFFLEIIVSIFAIYYGFVLSRVVNDFKEFKQTLDLLHIDKMGLTGAQIKHFNMLEKQLVNCTKINAVRVYEDLSSHIDDYFSEGDFGSSGPVLMKRYYELYRSCSVALSISEWLIIVLLSMLIVVLCFVVRENNIISTVTTIVIGATICLCVSVLYEYAAKKRRFLEKLIVN